jgi:tetratricopeptide (TPR) repeat protein/DNA-binding MarR family transcriptional regulator
MLLYLERFDKYISAWEVPFGVSQDGIGEALGILINNVSRTLSAMKEEGLVFSRLAHVRGIVRRRRVYFLTNEGREEANHLKSRLGSTMIPYGDSQGLPQELTLSRVRDIVSKEIHRTVIVFDIVEFLRDRDVVSPGELSNYIKQRIITPQDFETIPKKFVHHISAMPSILSFVGRAKELNELREWMNSTKRPILVIQGIAGIGKSALAAKLADEYKEHKNLFWFRFHEWNTLRNLADDLSKFLSQSGRKHLATRMRGNKSIDITDFGNLFIDEIQGLNALLFFDDTQKADSQMLSLLSFVVERWSNPADVGVIVLSRELGKFYDSRDVVVSKAIKEITLTGLDEDETRTLLGRELAARSEEIYSLTKGHPLFLEILISSGKMEFTHDINAFLEHEILSRLDTNEKQVLEKLCVFRYPAPIPQILEERMEYGLVSSLSKKGLVDETQENLIESHEMIKDFIYNHLPLEKAQALHGKAADYYLELERTKGEGGIEALYHLQKAGLWKKAVGLAMEIYPSLEELGLQEVKEMFSAFRTDTLSDSDSADLSFLKGEIFSYYDEWYEALENYGECLRLKEAMDAEPETMAKIHNRIGEVLRYIRRWEETIDSHSKALSLFEKAGDQRGLAREHLNLGIVYKEMRNFQKAKEHYEKSKNILSNLKDKKGLAAVHNNLGMLNLKMGKFGKAKMCFDLGLKYANEENDILSQAITVQNLGELSLVKEVFEEAIKYFQQSQEMFYNQGQVKEAQELALRLGDVYIEIDEPNEAIKAFKRGLDLESLEGLEPIKKRKIFRSKTISPVQTVSKTSARLHSRLATVYRELQMWGDCDSERLLALHNLDRLGNPSDIALEMMEQALDYEDSKKYEKAVGSLQKGLGIIRRGGDNKGLVAFNLNLGRIFQKKGDIENALKSSKDALSESEAIQDWVGANKACDILLELSKKIRDEEGKKHYNLKLKEIKRKLGEK